MTATIKEVLAFVRENDVKFIRLAFCDLFGLQKNISIMPGALERAFEEGISFSASSIRGFAGDGQGDLLLFPDPTTLSVLPWRPQQGRVVRFYCDIRHADGRPFACDTRMILQRVIALCDEMGYSCRVGAKCAFYLFKTDEDGDPTTVPLDSGGYFDMSPLDKGENVRREICLCLEEMGIPPEHSHHERGPGQNEIDFAPADPLGCADSILTLKWVVKSIAAQNGLFASFLPKPLEGKSGSGLHISMALTKGGQNLFRDPRKGHSEVAESFIAGVLSKVPEITAFLNPIADSYRRFGSFEAPQHASWSHQDRSHLIRIPAARGERVRMELRSPDCAANPYLAVALVMAAGLGGVGEGLRLPAASSVNFLKHPDQAAGLDRLPASLEEAIRRAKGSALAREVLGEEALGRYIEEKERELGSDTPQDGYFLIV